MAGYSGGAQASALTLLTISLNRGGQRHEKGIGSECQVPQRWGRNPGRQSSRKDSHPMGHLPKALGRGRDTRAGTYLHGAQKDTQGGHRQGWCYSSLSSGLLFCLICFPFSTTKSKELSPGSAQKGSPGSSQGTACAGTQPGAQPGAQPGTSPSPSQPPADQSPHTLRKGMPCFPSPWSQAGGGYDIP